MQGSYQNWSVVEMLKAFYQEWDGMRKKHESLRDQLATQNKDLENLWKSHEKTKMDVANITDFLNREK